MKRCARCGKLMSGEDCQYCALMDSINGNKRNEEGIEKNRVTSEKSNCMYVYQRNKGNEESNNSMKIQYNPGNNKADMLESIKVNCKYDPLIAVSFEALTEICQVMIENRGSPVDVIVIADLDDRNIFTKIEHIDRNRKTTIRVETSTKGLMSEYSSSWNVRLTVSFTDREVIHCETFTITVRPMFDVSLSDVKEEIPHWVTPNSLEIKSLLALEGPVMKAMAKIGDPQISGYQGESPKSILKNVMMQLNSVYDGLKNLGIKYVSDTNSLGNNLTYSYQRVKLPYKVLEERTGNCIELSCLFASVLEAMGLYPIIVYPPGHAMIGVVLSSKQLPYVNKYEVNEHPDVFRLEIKDTGNGKPDTIQAIFLECTAICTTMNFDQAIDSATAAMNKNIEPISKDEDFTVIVYERHFNKKRPMNH